MKIIIIVIITVITTIAIVNIIDNGNYFHTHTNPHRQKAEELIIQAEQLEDQAQKLIFGKSLHEQIFGNYPDYRTEAMRLREQADALLLRGSGLTKFSPEADRLEAQAREIEAEMSFWRARSRDDSSATNAQNMKNNEDQVRRLRERATRLRQ